MTSIVAVGNARALQLPDASVDLIVTSPPYWSLRDYRDGGASVEGQIGAEPTPGEYVAALLECTREWARVLKPEGSLWVNLGDKYNAYNGGRGQGSIQRNDVRQAVPRGFGLDVKGIRPKSLLGLPWRYALGCVDELGLILRAEVIWSKVNGMPESVTDRVRRSHEQWFHLVKQPRYFSAVDDIRQVYDGDRALSRRVKRQGNGKRDQRVAWDGPHPRGALPGSVWDVPLQPFKAPKHLGVDHHAAFPPGLVRRIILGWSPPDRASVVLDPFGGTGTTALVASAHGRVGVSIDLSRDYCRLAQWRTQDPRQRARALGVAEPPAVMDGQIGIEVP